MSLTQQELGPDPVIALKQWLAEARDAHLGDEPVATLATTDHSGAPDARLVVVRNIDHDGLTFFNDTRSPKGRQLAANPRAAMVFYWKSLGRQVRVRGRTAVLSPEESDRAFHGRERRSQIGYWANEQSVQVSNRAQLEQNLDEVIGKFDGQNLTRPQHWVVYSLRPEYIEFWQSGERHLHDRIAYDLTNNEWRVERLQP